MEIRSFQKKSYSFTSGDFSMEILPSMKTSQKMTLMSLGQNKISAHAVSEIKKIFKLDNEPDLMSKALGNDMAKSLKSTI